MHSGALYYYYNMHYTFFHFLSSLSLSFFSCRSRGFKINSILLIKRFGILLALFSISARATGSDDDYCVEDQHHLDALLMHKMSIFQKHLLSGVKIIHLKSNIVNLRFDCDELDFDVTSLLEEHEEVDDGNYYRVSALIIFVALIFNAVVTLITFFIMLIATSRLAIIYRAVALVTLRPLPSYLATTSSWGFSSSDAASVQNFNVESSDEEAAQEIFSRHELHAAEMVGIGLQHTVQTEEEDHVAEHAPMEEDPPMYHDDRQNITYGTDVMCHGPVALKGFLSMQEKM